MKIVTFRVNLGKKIFKIIKRLCQNVQENALKSSDRLGGSLSQESWRNLKSLDCRHEKIGIFKTFFPGKQQWSRGISTPIRHICAYQLVRVELNYVQLVESMFIGLK